MSKTKYHLRYLVLHLKAIIPSLIEDLKPKPEKPPISAKKLLRDIEKGIYRPRTIRRLDGKNPLFISIEEQRELHTILSRRDLHHQHTDE